MSTWKHPPRKHSRHNKIAYASGWWLMPAAILGAAIWWALWKIIT